MHASSRTTPHQKRTTAVGIAGALALLLAVSSTAFASPRPPTTHQATIQVTATVISVDGRQAIQSATEEFTEIFEQWQSATVIDGDGAIDQLDRLVERGLIRISVSEVGATTNVANGSADSGNRREILVEYVGS